MENLIILVIIITILNEMNPMQEQFKYNVAFHKNTKDKTHDYKMLIFYAETRKINSKSL